MAFPRLLMCLMMVCLLWRGLAVPLRSSDDPMELSGDEEVKNKGRLVREADTVVVQQDSGSSIKPASEQGTLDETPLDVQSRGVDSATRGGDERILDNSPVPGADGFRLVIKEVVPIIVNGGNTANKYISMSKENIVILAKFLKDRGMEAQEWTFKTTEETGQQASGEAGKVLTFVLGTGQNATQIVVKVAGDFREQAANDTFTFFLDGLDSAIKRLEDAAEKIEKSSPIAPALGGILI